MIRCYSNLLGLVLLAMLAFSPAAVAQSAVGNPEILVIDAAAPPHPFPHFWEHMFGSGRASLSMRESYRQDLRRVKQVTDVGYIRFHAIFLDEMGVYDEDSAGRPVYNFSYVDQVYDGLLQNGVRPFVELSFMPKKLASKDAPHAFWYKQNVAPPKDWVKWDDLIDRFTRHLVDRYGVDEVAKWYFEVWNEPNIDFWVGEPKQSTYWELYDHSVTAVKRVSNRFRVGGPATAQAAWADAFIQHCVDKHIPVDFVSTHVYGNDGAQDVFGTNENIPRERMVCRAVKKVHDQIKASALPSLPLIWSEFNASYKNSGSAIVTRASDGSLVVAVWNLIPPDQTGTAKSVVLRFKNVGGARHASISRVDRDHGDPHPAYENMGSPVYPTQAQLQKLRDAVESGPPEVQELKGGELSLTLPADGLAVIGIR